MSVRLIRHGELVLGDTDRKISVVEQSAVVEPNNFVARRLVGRRSSYAVSQ